MKSAISCARLTRAIPRPDRFCGPEAGESSPVAILPGGRSAPVRQRLPGAYPADGSSVVSPASERRCALRGRPGNRAHQVTIVEMIPAHKVSADIPLEFEISGLGAGNRTVDWVISPEDGRTVLLDVKRRTADFIRQAELMGGEGAAPEPDHDPALSFRSVEQKFVLADPDVQLQGVWIFADIQQDEEFLHNTFAALDAGKVHFAILGDWKPDAYVLARRDEDWQYLLDLFHAEPSTRFTFRRVDAG